MGSSGNQNGSFDNSGPDYDALKIHTLSFMQSLENSTWYDPSMA